jgi:hypothetical protein
MPTPTPPSVTDAPEISSPKTFHKFMMPSPPHRDKDPMVSYHEKHLGQPELKILTLLGTNIGFKALRTWLP